MKLDEIVPWGRSLTEYRLMFNMTDEDLKKSILGVGDGPASFNAELTPQGGRVISIDPVYAFDADAIRQRIDQTYQTIVEQTRVNANRYQWITFKTPDEMGKHRMDSMQHFLQDYPAGLAEGRYQLQQLPKLAFADQTFDLALVSHLLFLYSEHLSADFHLDSVRELLRVTTEVRIFPLLGLNGSLSPHLPIVEEHLVTWGFNSQRITVSYEFQKGGNQMLRIIPGNA